MSAQTLARLEELSAWHDRALDWSDPAGPGPWSEEEFDRFDAAARELLGLIAVELGPEFDVFYDELGRQPRPDVDLGQAIWDYLELKRRHDSGLGEDAAIVRLDLLDGPVPEDIVLRFGCHERRCDSYWLGEDSSDRYDDESPDKVELVFARLLDQWVTCRSTRRISPRPPSRSRPCS